MDNRQGKSNIAVGNMHNAGHKSVSNIGLLNLAKQAPQWFNNDGGVRDIVVADMMNKGDKSVFMIGESPMSNKKGSSNIKVGKSVNVGKGSVSEIGLLQNLRQTIQNEDGQRNIMLGTVTDSSYNGQVHVGATPVYGGEHKIRIGTFNQNGYHTHDTIGTPEHKDGPSDIKVGKINATGMGSKLDIFLI